MSKVFLLVFLLISATIEKSPSYVTDNCTKRDSAIVTEQWNQAFGPNTSDATEFFVGYMVFAPLFYGDPGVRQLLSRVGSKGMQTPEFQAHLMRVINTLGVIVDSLQNEQLVGQLTSHLKRQHQALPGMKPKYMKYFMDTLKSLMPKIVSDFNADVFDNCLVPIAMEIAEPAPISIHVS